MLLNDILEGFNFAKNVLQASRKSFGAGVPLTFQEKKDIKVINSLENRRNLLKGTTRKITSQKGEFLNSLRPLMAAGSPLMRTAFAPLTKNILLPFGLLAGISAADAAIQKKFMDQVVLQT